MYIYYQTAKLHSDDFGDSSESLNELGYDYVGQFDVGVDKLSPFWQFGAGYGSMKGEYLNQDSRYTFSFKLGAGVSYYVIPQVELLASVNYQYRIWQDVEYSIGYQSETFSTHDSGVNVVVGINYWPFASDNSSTSEDEENGIY